MRNTNGIAGVSESEVLTMPEDPWSAAKIAMIGAAATVITAVISGVVSWVVSDHALEREEWRDRAENTVQRAELFKDLIDQVGSGDKANYAILALWKLYQDDRRLVLITALQSDDPQAIEVLRLLGLEQELVGFEDTFINVIDKARAERRMELLQLLSDINPKARIDLSIEAILEEQPIDFKLSTSFEELTSLLQQRPEFRDRVAERMASDERISRSVANRFTFALALYFARDSDPFDFLIRDASENMALFGQLAPLINRGSQFVNYKEDDKVHLLRLSVELMRHSSSIEDGSTLFFHGLSVFQSMHPQIQLEGEEQAEILEMFHDYFREIPNDRVTRERILRVVAALDRERARKLYYFAISCEDLHIARNFYYASSASEFVFDGRELPDFEASQSEGIRQLEELDLTCERWSDQ